MGYTNSKSTHREVKPKSATDGGFTTKAAYDPTKHAPGQLEDGEYTPQQITERLEKNAAEIEAAVYAADDPVMSTPLTAFGKSSAPVVKVPALPSFFASKDVNIGRKA